MTRLYLLLFSIYVNANGGDVFPYPKEPRFQVESVKSNLINEYNAEVATEKTDEKLSVRFQKKNLSLLSDLKGSGTSSNSLNKMQAEQMTKFLIDHPIAGDIGVQKFSGKNRGLGYCFGRAALAHVELLRRAVKPESIRKIFVIGEVKYNKNIWELHIATIVKKTGGGWWVLDGLFNETLEVQDWYKRLLKIAVNTKDPKVKLYLSDPVKFLPVSGAYDQKDMYRPEYNGFFEELTRWLVANPVKKEDSFFGVDSQ